MCYLLIYEVNVVVSLWAALLLNLSYLMGMKD